MHRHDKKEKVSKERERVLLFSRSKFYKWQQDEAFYTYKQNDAFVQNDPF